MGIGLVNYNEWTDKISRKNKSRSEVFLPSTASQSGWQNSRVRSSKNVSETNCTKTRVLLWERSHTHTQFTIRRSVSLGQRKNGIQTVSLIQPLVSAEPFAPSREHYMSFFSSERHGSCSPDSSAMPGFALQNRNDLWEYIQPSYCISTEGDQKGSVPMPIPPAVPRKSRWAAVRSWNLTELEACHVGYQRCCHLSISNHSMKVIVAGSGRIFPLDRWIMVLHWL